MRIFNPNVHERRIPLFLNPGFRIDVSFREQLPFFHFIWTGKVAWSTTQYKELLDAVSQIRDKFREHGYETLYVYVPLEKLRLATACGFTPTYRLIMNDGTELILAEQATCLKSPS